MAQTKFQSNHLEPSIRTGLAFTFAFASAFALALALVRVTHSTFLVATRSERRGKSSRPFIHSFFHTFNQSVNQSIKQTNKQNSLEALAHVYIYRERERERTFRIYRMKLYALKSMRPSKQFGLRECGRAVWMEGRKRRAKAEATTEEHGRFTALQSEKLPPAP